MFFQHLTQLAMGWMTLWIKNKTNSSQAVPPTHTSTRDRTTSAGPPRPGRRHLLCTSTPELPCLTFHELCNSVTPKNPHRSSKVLRNRVVGEGHSRGKPMAGSALQGASGVSIIWAENRPEKDLEPLPHPGSPHRGLLDPELSARPCLGITRAAGATAGSWTRPGSKGQGTTEQKLLWSRLSRLQASQVKSGALGDAGPGGSDPAAHLSQGLEAPPTRGLTTGLTQGWSACPGLAQEKCLAIE